MADYEFEKFIPMSWAGHTVVTSQDGTELLRIQFRRLHLQMQVKAAFTPQITFAEFATTKFEPVIPRLTNLHDTVVKTVASFRDEF